MAEPTYFASVLASAAGANKHHMTVWNGTGSGKRLKLYSILVAGAPTAAVTGMVIPLHVTRITGAAGPVGGTQVAVGKAATLDAAPPAALVVRANPTQTTGAMAGITEDATPFGIGAVTGEETGSPSQVDLYSVPSDWLKPVEIAEGQGFTVKQGALASAGNIHLLAVFSLVT